MTHLLKLQILGYFKFSDSVLYVIYAPISLQTFFLTSIYFLIQDIEYNLNMMKIEGLIVIVSVICNDQINVKLIKITTKYYFHVTPIT